MTSLGSEIEALDGAPSRDRIMESALALFFRQGFRGTTVREITTECGLTSGALYNHFPSKEALLYAVVCDAIDGAERAIEDALRRASPGPAARLRALVFAAALFNTRHRPASVVAMFEYVSLPEPERSTVVARRLAARRRIESLLEEGLRDGTFSLPDTGDGIGVKTTATAIANIAIRATDAFGPTPTFGAEADAALSAELALRMVGAPLEEVSP